MHITLEQVKSITAINWDTPKTQNFWGDSTLALKMDINESRAR